MWFAALKHVRRRTSQKNGNMIMADTKPENAVLSNLKRYYYRKNRQLWSNLKTLIKIESTRIIKDRQMQETRYYISDEEGFSAAYFNSLVRGHWSIENHLHWHPDVTFREDNSRVRKGNAPENLSTLRKLALQIIKEHNDKLSLKKRRLKAAYHVEYLKNLIT
jgi:predicted transposase YbfD/YdcC